MNEPLSIAIILPAKNEGRGIGQVIDEIHALPLEHKMMVIVAENGSTDDTAAVAEQKGAMVIKCSPPKGCAVRHVLDQIVGQYNYVFMMNSDYTYPAKYILPMLEKLLRGADVVVGVRRKRHPGAMSSLHYFGNRLISFGASVLYDHWVSDALSGMWGFYAPAIPALGLTSDGFTLEADIFSGAMLAGLRLREVPIEYRPRVGTPSKLKFMDAFRISWFLLRRRFRHG